MILTLDQLCRLPMQIVKVDRSIIDDLEHSPEQAALVKAVFQVARTLKVQPLAEGIERPAQAAVLQDLRCVFGQGYLFGHPVDADLLPAGCIPWTECSAFVGHAGSGT